MVAYGTRGASIDRFSTRSSVRRRNQGPTSDPPPRAARAPRLLHSPDIQSGCSECLAVEQRLDVDKAAALHDFACEHFCTHVTELAMGDGHYHRIGHRQLLPGHKL